VFPPEKSIIEQKQLWSDVVSYNRALRAALRQKPDIILFWEMRDLESIEKAVTLAETWHLVLSTIHSKSSSQTINKIIDSFPAEQQNQIRIQLSETLVSVISQRLLRKKDWSWMVAAHEIMVNNSAISNLIRENQIKQINNVIQTSRWQWMQILEEHLIELLEKWIIDQENAVATANNPSYITSEVKNRWIIV
jgi:twitching motility protein PilT